MRDASDIWLFYALTALQLGLSAFFFPARNALLPDLVSAEELPVANALTSSTWSIMLAFGTALGGLLAGIIGVHATFIIDALSFLVSAFLIVRIKHTEISRVKSKNVSIKNSIFQYLDGWRFLKSNPSVMAVALHKGANDFFIVGGLNVFLVLLAKDYFPLGKGGGISIGLTWAAAGIGSGVGPLIARHFTRDRVKGIQIALIVCYVVSAIGIGIIATMSGLIGLIVGAFMRGMGGGLMYVFSSQLLMQSVPSSHRGRIFSIEFAFRTFLSAAGAAIVGIGIDSTLGIQGVLWISTCAALVPGILWTLWLRRQSVIFV